MQLRELRWADADAVVALWRRTGRDVVPEPELAALLAHDPGLSVVAEEGDGVVGVALGTFDGRRGRILRLGVDPARRRRGIATALVGELERRLHARGAPRINVHVLPGNVEGLAFWRRPGYVDQPDVLCSKPVG